MKKLMEEEKEMNNMNGEENGMKKKKKVGTGIAIAILAVVTVAGSFTELPTPSYEKPLEAQVEAINEQNEDQYWKTFDENVASIYKAGGYGLSNVSSVKDVSYEVTKVEDTDVKSDDMKGFIGAIGLSDDEVEKAKRMEIDVTYTQENGKKETESVPYTTIKIDGEWYSVVPLAVLFA